MIQRKERKTFFLRFFFFISKSLSMYIPRSLSALDKLTNSKEIIPKIQVN
jgi:hypothetical protein